jgi:hypothetical protein
VFALCALEDVIARVGDSNLVFTAHCALPEGREVSDQEEVLSPVTPKIFRRVMRRFDSMPKK